MSDNQNLFDTDTSHYSLVELMMISGVNELEPHEIVMRTNTYINKFKIKNPTLATFFRKIQSQLLQYANGLQPEDSEDEHYAPVEEGFSNMQTPDAEYPEGEKQTNDWYEN
jgi:replication fork clamp-binding protein CrfC